MRKYNISANLVRTIEQLYDKATSAVQMNGSIGEWFRTTVGVRQGCLLSPTLFNIFLKQIMSDALEEHDGKVRIGGRNITNLRSADDIDALAEEEQELEALVESLDKSYNLDTEGMGLLRSQKVRVGVVWPFLLSSILFLLFLPLSPSLWETARYRLKYCLKGPLNPKQPTNQNLHKV